MCFSSFSVNLNIQVTTLGLGCISFQANALEKGMNLSLQSQTIDKYFDSMGFLDFVRQLLKKENFEFQPGVFA